MKKLRKLHLGCGRNHIKGYLNCDISKEVSPDKVLDLEESPLPFGDDSMSEVKAEHVFEHIRNFVGLMHEIHRICKRGAKVKVKVPFYASCEQASDPTHVRSFSPFTFDYFNVDSSISKFSHEVGAEKNMFKINKTKINYSTGRSRLINFLFNPLINLNHRIYCKFFSGILQASEIEFELEVLK